MTSPLTQDLARARWQRRFWPTLFGIFAITVSYPIAMLWILRADVFEYARNDLAWSFHSLFLVPIAFGLLATAFSSEFFMRIGVWQRVTWIFVFVGLVIPTCWAVFEDKQLIPTPDRVAESLQRQAIKIDQCLRNSCPDKASYSKNVNDNCRNRPEYSEAFSPNRLSLDSEPLKLAQAYLCTLLQEAGGQAIAPGSMVTIILILKIILTMFVGSFVWFALFLAFNRFNSIDLGTLYALIGCYVILVTWFPFQLYAEWYQWYGDLSHVLLYNAFWVLFVVALLLLFLFAAWVVILLGKANLITTVASIHSVVVAVFAGLFYFKPEFINAVFGVLEHLPTPYFIVLMFVLLLYMTVYVRQAYP